MATYSASISPEYFPQATCYAGMREAGSGLVRDSARRKGFPYSERHLQCVWFDPALRPPVMKTDRGEEVIVEHPGQWNLEDGPDFLDAALRIGPEQRRIEGDVEIHIRPADWKHHGHHHDARYERVRVHVTQFDGELEHHLLPAGTIHIALKDQLRQNPYFSFDSVDLTAYPYAVKTGSTPCLELLKAWSPEERMALLDAAGQERLRQKADRMAADIEIKGPTQVLYEELMSALGYKHNKEAFRYLAERVPLVKLQAEAAGDSDIAYAILMGVSGLLPSNSNAHWDTDTRQFIRSLWDVWWRVREQWEGHVMTRRAWKLSGIRPVNHPARRMMAAAELFTRATTPDTRILYLGEHHSETFTRDAAHWLETLSNTYWDRRLSFNRPKQKRNTALIGKTRSASIITNTLVPFLAAMDESIPFTAGLLSALPPESSNAIVRQTAHVLFGIDHTEKLYRTGLRTQGLLQIFHDFCVNDRTRCTKCPLPDALRKYRRP